MLITLSTVLQLVHLLVISSDIYFCLGFPLPSSFLLALFKQWYTFFFFFKLHFMFSSDFFTLLQHVVLMLHYGSVYECLTT